MSTTLRACIVTVFLLAAARAACAQSGAATARLTGQVSAALALSADGARALGEGAQVAAANVDANTVAVSITSSGGGDARVRIPLRLRSNVGYSLRASFVSLGELNVRLSVADARATGKLVHADAFAGIKLADSLAGAQADARDYARAGALAPSAASLTVQNSSAQLAVLSGPPVSKAGTFNSPDNAIEIVLSIELRPRAPKESWSTQLTISAAPNPQAGR